MTAQNVREKLEELEERSESWRPDGQLKKCWALEDRLKIGLSYFHQLRNADEMWSRSVQAGDLPFDPDIARLFRDGYDWFFGPCEAILREINQVEQFYPVDGADEFRKALQFVLSVRRLPVEKLIRAIGQAQRRETRPLDEVMDELCRGANG